MADPTPRLLLVSMYPLDQGLWGPTVRIAHLREALAASVRLDVVAGYRGRRRAALVRYAVSGRLRGLDGIYVESSTFLPAEVDLAFLGIARALGVPVLTYVRDAYQLFDDYGTPTSLRGKLGRAAFRPAIRALRAVSSRMAFPTAGLAAAVLGPESDAVLVPPGAPEPVEVPLSADADRLLFVGDARLPAQGADRLVRAVELARRAGPEVSLTLVCQPGKEPPPPHPAWLRIERASGVGIAALLPRAIGTAVPRPRNAYNDLALPIKLFDYLSYGRPVLVTDCAEQARIVTAADAGIVTADDPAAIADGIVRLVNAPPAQVARWSANATAAARAASWEDRARQIVNVLLSSP